MSQDDNFLASFVAPIHHGCLILRDGDTQTGHGRWDPGAAPFEVIDDSLIFAVNAAVDGPVHVSVFDGEPNGPSGIHYFTASLPISARKIILHDPNEEVQLSFRRPLGDLTVTVFADSGKFPDFVEIYLGSV